MAQTGAERQKRARAHKRGDHSHCDPDRCDGVTPAVTRDAKPVTTVTKPAVVTPDPNPGPDVDHDELDPDEITDSDHPAGLGPRGRRLYAEVLAEQKELRPRDRVLLEEVARSADRLETLHRILAGDTQEWARVVVDDWGNGYLVVDKTLAEARAQQMTFARLIAELRTSLAPVPAKTAGGATAAAPGTGTGGGQLADLAARIKERWPAAAG